MSSKSFFCERIPLALLTFLLCAFAFLVVPGWVSVVGARTEAQATNERVVPLLAPRLASLEPSKAADDLRMSVEVRAGQTMGELFKDQNLPVALLQRVMGESARGQALAHIRPGQRIVFSRCPSSHRLTALTFDPSTRERVTIRIAADGAIETAAVDRPIERHVMLASGVVTSSLFGAGDDAGMSDAMITEMAKVLGYDIDFARDIQRGDRFSVVYEAHYQDGEPIGGGAILAVSFVNGGKTFTAIRHGDDAEPSIYFDADGRPLRKAFLRTPVEFSRISSKFSLGRMHPVLGRMRAHRGVDYAAPSGTPIMASGDGRVTFRGWKSGYGNTVVIDHGNGKTTLYAHLSRFDNAVKNGYRVRQGENIGFVGMTGLATGPHLHYEFRIDGVHRDPLTVVLPKAESLQSTELVAFKRRAAPLLAKLELLDQRDRLLAHR